jgi:hypothetical protein
MNEDHKRFIIQMAKSRTEDVYKKRLDELKTINEAWANYLDEKKDQFVTYLFLKNGYRRWGKVTSNAVETMNGSLLQQRSMPILFMIEGIVKYHGKSMWRDITRQVFGSRKAKY